MRASVFEHIPSRRLGTNVGGRPALVISIVPLLDILLLHRRCAQTSQFARPAGPLQRTGEYMRKPDSAQKAAEFNCAALPFGRQRQIRMAGVLTRKGPLRLSMPYQDDLCGHGGNFKSIVAPCSRERGQGFFAEPA